MKALVAAGFAALLLAALALILWVLFGTGGESAREELTRTGAVERAEDWLAAPARSDGDAPSAVAEHAASVARREDVSARAVPGGALLLRVVDAAGAPVAGIPVGLVDLRAAPLPFFALARLWNPSGDGGWDPEIPAQTSQHFWTFERGVVRRAAMEEVVTEEIEVEREESNDAAAMDAPPPTEDFDVEIAQGQVILDPVALPRPEAEAWWPRTERPTLWLADAFHWRGTTDERGEVFARWDRARAPEVEVAFAFPCRTRGLRLLRAEEPPPSAAIELVLPPIARAELVGVHDLDVRRDARWKARLAARAEFRDGSPAWIAWDDYAPLGANDAAPQALIWERGLPVRLEAYLDAPFAPLLALELEDGGPARRALRSAEHYAGVRAELRDANGRPQPTRVVEHRLIFWPEQGAKRIESAELALDARSRFELVLAAAPTPMRARELHLHLQRRSSNVPHDPYADGLSIGDVLYRPSALDSLETHVDLSTPEASGVVRELATQTLGDGPHLLAGRVQWQDGAPIQGARVILPRGLASELVDEDAKEGLETDASGAFRRLGIPRTPSFEVEVLTGSFGPRPRFTVQAGRRDLLLEVPRRGGLAGRVLFERPQDLVVSALGSDGHASIARPNPQGEFAVQGIAVGPVKLSIRVAEVELASLSDLVLHSAQLERPSALREIDLRDAAHVTTLVLRGERGELLPRATVAVRDPAGSYSYAGNTSRLGELRLVVPRGIGALVVAVPGYRDQEIAPLAGRVEVGLVREG